MSEEIRSLEDLLRAVGGGLRPRYLFFWGHRPPPGGEVGKSCFSQWWPAAFEVAGVTYPTAEHYMMAEKARLFGDDETRGRILKADGPKAAKELGRRVKNFDERAWAEARFRLVVEGNMAKFGQNVGLGEFLVGTGDAVLVEASPVDRVWGIGLSADDERASDPGRWRGLNLLGFALMEVRGRLGRAGEPEDYSASSRFGLSACGAKRRRRRAP